MNAHGQLSRTKAMTIIYTYAHVSGKSVAIGGLCHATIIEFH